MTPPLAELIAWANVQVAETTRRNFRDIDTRGIDEAEAQRRLALAKGVVAALEAFAANAPAQVAALSLGASAISGGGTADGRAPTLDIAIRCGAAWHQDSYINAPFIAANGSVRATLMEVITSRVVTVLERGTQIEKRRIYPSPPAAGSPQASRRGPRT